MIFQTLDLVQELSGQRGERAQREFLQCRRAAHESLDSFLMRVEAQRDLMLEEDSEFAMGERFLVGHVLDKQQRFWQPAWGRTVAVLATVVPMALTWLRRRTVVDLMVP